MSLRLQHLEMLNLPIHRKLCINTTQDLSFPNSQTCSLCGFRHVTDVSHLLKDLILGVYYSQNIVLLSSDAIWLLEAESSSFCQPRSAIDDQISSYPSSFFFRLLLPTVAGSCPTGPSIAQSPFPVVPNYVGSAGCWYEGTQRLWSPGTRISLNVPRSRCTNQQKLVNETMIITNYS